MASKKTVIYGNRLGTPGSARKAIRIAPLSKAILLVPPIERAGDGRFAGRRRQLGNIDGTIDPQVRQRKLSLHHKNEFIELQREVT